MSSHGPGKAGAKLRGISMSPKKINLFATLVRRMHVDDALAQCRLHPKKAGKIIAGVGHASLLYSPSLPFYHSPPFPSRAGRQELCMPVSFVAFTIAGICGGMGLMTGPCLLWLRGFVTGNVCP